MFEVVHAPRTLISIKVKQKSKSRISRVYYISRIYRELIQQPLKEAIKDELKLYGMLSNKSVNKTINKHSRRFLSEQNTVSTYTISQTFNSTSNTFDTVPRSSSYSITSKNITTLTLNKKSSHSLYLAILRQDTQP